MLRHCGLQTFIFATLLATAMAISSQGWAQPKIVVQGDQTRHAGEFVVPINKSQVLQLDVPFADLLVGNSGIADVLAYGREKNLIAVLDLVVAPDIEGLKARLFEIMPDEKIEARAANGSIVLSGTVSGASTLDQILAVSERFAPGLVTNLLAVEGSQQVMLRVRFVETSRSITKELGFNFSIVEAVEGSQQVMLRVRFVETSRSITKELGFNFSIVEGDFSFSSGLNQFGSGIAGSAIEGVPFVTGALTGATVGAIALDALFDALEEKSLAKTLAEPNLVALSGDTASFLAGGEFPVETVTEDGQTQTEFKPFGVRLAFTPTVLDDGLINLIVTPESSQPDFRFGDPPGLSVRRATTTIELRDGQAFAIAGLLEDNFDDSVEQVPLLGEVPVLGALFRSSKFQKNETELVIIVEAHLVQPAPIGSLATPADNFIPPSESDIWLFGRIEAPGSGVAAQGAGGIGGHYGHIIK
jgi:pilus assembly protein CpaC